MWSTLYYQQLPVTQFQVSILTICTWVGGQITSYAVVSDYTGHDKYFTLFALTTIIDRLLADHPEVSFSSFYYIFSTLYSF